MLHDDDSDRAEQQVMLVEKELADMRKFIGVMGIPILQGNTLSNPIDDLINLCVVNKYDPSFLTTDMVYASLGDDSKDNLHILYALLTRLGECRPGLAGLRDGKVRTR